MPISFVGQTSATSQGNDTSFQLLKPTGISAGDFLIGVVATFPGRNEGKATITPPSGWTVVSDFISQSGQVQPCQLTIMTKTATGSEPGSWVGTYSASAYVESQLCVAYRGVLAIESSDTAVTGNATSLNVGPVTSSQETDWRITIGAYSSSSVSFAIESNELTERVVAGLKRSDDTCAVMAGVWDSGGAVSIGSHTRNITRDGTWGSAAAYLAILDATDVSIEGTLEADLPLPTVAGAGKVSVDGPLAVTMPKPAFSGSGFATPPSGTLDVLVLPMVSVSGAVNPTGELEASILPVVDVVAETRRFGIRVVIPEPESRVIVPRLSAVD